MLNLYNVTGTRDRWFLHYFKRFLVLWDRGAGIDLGGAFTGFFFLLIASIYIIKNNF